MKKFFKWLMISIGSLVIIALLVLVSIKFSFEHRLHKKYTIAEEQLSYTADSALIARGHHIAEVSCQHCHGEQLQGSIFFNDPKLGQIIAPNLTRGKGGIGTFYTASDFVKAIRHGVRPNSNPLLIMPAEDFYNLSDKDLAAVISYIRQVPPVNSSLPATRLKPMTKLLMGAGMFGMVIPAEVIDHSPNVHAEVTPSVTPEYGNYMASTNGCKACHGANLGGSKPPDPASPQAPNLTMGSISVWTEADFIHAMRTGERPGGQAAMSKYMPWKTLGRMTDDELKAVWAYLQSVPKVQPRGE